MASSFLPQLPREPITSFEGTYDDEDVDLRRLYYWGKQYEGLNDQIAAQLGKSNVPGDKNRLKEHQRAHAYSTHIQEGLDFLADQITGQMILQPEPEVDESTGQPIPDTENLDVQEFLDQLWERSRLKNRNQEIAREVLIAGNLACEIRMVRTADPEIPGAKFIFWQVPNECRLHYSAVDWVKLEKVEVFPDDEIVYVYLLRIYIGGTIVDPETGEETPGLREECVRETWEADSYETDRARKVAPDERLGIPFIPFVHLHGENEGLRSMFGRSMITTQLMQTADRYNAGKQLEFLALRYNSFATLAVTGDMVHLQNTEQDSNVDRTMILRKDLGEFITFPGGTGVHTIELPTDTNLIQSQTEALIDSMFGLMGLERINKDTISSFGGVSGYALEILNRKTDGTFRRITENMREGFLLMVQGAFKVDAYSTAPAGVDPETGESILEWWLVDPDTVWPDQKVLVDFGSAYIVDEVAVRDDFTAKIISRAEALRKKGYTAKQIKVIEDEIEDRAAAAPVDDVLEQGSRFSTERA